MTAASITASSRVEWSDTDASGHWHHTTVFRFIEWTETALLDSLGILGDVYDLGLPRVRIDVSFRKPAYFDEIVETEVQVQSVGRSSVTYEFSITGSGNVYADGIFVAVLRGEDMKPKSWPAEWKQLLLTAGPQNLPEKS